MSNFVSPRYRALDNNGAPISGAVLYFYQNGTTTPRSTYPTLALAEAGGAGANANPVVADANGWFGRIYLQPDYLYTVVLKDAVGGTTLWSADDVDSAFLNSSSIAERIEQIASNPMDNGATGDGVADDSTAVQAAITNATGVVDLLGKTYRCDSALTLKSGITIRNGGLDFSACTDNEYLVCDGSRTTGKALTANSLPGASSATLDSVSGIAAGDLVWLGTDDVYGAASGSDGELCVVSGVLGLVVSFLAPIRGTYLTTGNATAYKITQKAGVVLDDVEITASSAASGTGILFAGDWCDNLRFVNCTFSGIKAAGVRLQHSKGVVIEACKFDTGAASSVGVELLDGCSGVAIASGVAFLGVPNGVKFGADGASREGLIRDVSIVGVFFDGCSTAGIHGGILSANISVASCIFRSINPADGINVTSVNDMRVFGCTFVGGDYGIDDTTCTNTQFLANYFTGQTTGQIKGSAAAAMTIVAATGNQAGISSTGYGSGDGVIATGGASNGDGVTGTGGATNGRGIVGVGTGTGQGVHGTGGATSGVGVEGVGTAAGPGVKGTGGATNGVGSIGYGTGSGQGVVGVGGASGSAGVLGYGTALGAGLAGIGGNSAGSHGCDATGGSGGGRGGSFTGTAAYPGVSGTGGPTAGNGVEGTGTGAGHGVTGTGGVTDGQGVRGTGGGNGSGVYGTGKKGVEGVSTSDAGVYGSGSGGAKGVWGVSSSVDEPAVLGESSNSGAGVTGDASSGTGYGVVAEADSSSPARSALRIVPQDADASSPDIGAVQTNSTTGGIRQYDGNDWGSVCILRHAESSVGSTVSNSSAETICFSHDIKANTLRVGSRVVVTGHVEGLDFNSGDIATRLRVDGLGSALMASISDALSASGSYRVVADFVVKSVGAGGKAILTNNVMTNIVTSLSAPGHNYDMAINTTVDNTIVLTLQMSAAHANNAARGLSLNVEVYG